MVHILFLYWPSGLLWWIKLFNHSFTGDDSVAIISIISFVLLAVFLIFIKKVSKNMLFILSVVFILILLLTLVGCSQMNYSM